MAWAWMRTLVNARVCSHRNTHTHTHTHTHAHTHTHSHIHWRTRIHTHRHTDAHTHTHTHTHTHHLFLPVTTILLQTYPRLIISNFGSSRNVPVDTQHVAARIAKRLSLSTLNWAKILCCWEYLGVMPVPTGAVNDAEWKPSLAVKTPTPLTLKTGSSLTGMM